MKKIAPILIVLLFTKCSNLKYLNAYDGWKGKPKMVEISYYNVEKEFWYGKQLIYYDSKGRILKQPNINRAGNIVDGEKKFIYDKKGNIIPVDFGIMGRLDKYNRKYLAEILYGFIQRDYAKVAEVHIQAGLVPQDTSKEEFAQALRSVGEPIFGQTIKDISGGNLLAQLFEITEKFNMPTQTPLLLLQKTMVVVEGVARKLHPETNIWETSRPVLVFHLERAFRDQRGS